MNNMSEESYIEQLFNQPVYSSDFNSDELFLKALQEELIFHYDHNEMYKNFCDRKNFNPRKPISSINDIPPVAVSVFKNLGYGLGSVPAEDIKLRLQSSATSGVPSTIVVDKITSRRQSKAMVKVMQEFIGKERKPFLVMDIDPRSEFKALLGARFAAIAGYLNFASKAGYFLKADKNGLSYFDIDAIKIFLKELPEEQPVVVFGFTYIMYANVLKSIRETGECIQLPKGSKIIHIGGWKKLESEKIDKDVFNKELSAGFGLNPTDVIDIYGFTEQMGLNYPDCPCGCKHTSSYVRVLTRDVVTRDVLPAGKEGMLEFITPIPHSYPGNAVLTDDMGIIYDEPCPFGRPGKRFKVTGRLKKAEIRGCGDILSNKLTFNKIYTSGNVDNSLNIQCYKAADVNLSLDSKSQLKSIIEGLKKQSEWLRNQPVDALIGIIGEASKKWLNDSKFSDLKDNGLLFLSNWCSYNHLRSVSEFGLRGNVNYVDKYLPFPTSDKHLLKANARGLVCHWMAGNVQILGLFALVQSIVTKNVNLIKVSARDNGVFERLISVFSGLEYTTDKGYTIYGDDLLKTIAIVYFSRNAIELGKMISEHADVRIAWGGRESVETVSNYPSRYDAETIIFGPKLSFSVIGKENLQDEHEVRKLARRVSVDVSVFDQTGCASPHNLFIEKNGIVSPEKFCTLLNEVMQKTELQIPKPTMSQEQISAIHSIRGVYDFKGKVYGSNNMSYTILLDDKVELDSPVYSRVIFVHAVDDINDSIKYINEDIQTIGIALEDSRAKEYAVNASKKGAARFPQIGRMLNFEMPWDGIVLMDRLVKWNTLFGPLC